MAGVDGTNGTNGSNGLPGADGATGPQGIIGLTGNAGTNGTNGLPGAAGTNGLAGVDGTNGTNGADGAPGLQGIPGTSASACTPYNWGDTGPDGGKVFYVDGSGCHGLEAQAADASLGALFTWSAAISAAAAYNITTITGTSGLNCSTTAFPATPNCWHLPSKNELSWLYEKKTVGGFANNNYWSSTENDSNNAWNQNFNNGNQNNNTKTTTYLVRAVRGFK